ncbi:hypothetical protein BRETT_004746 [Brettanomyces bruxellensis]|uniref:Uncharacterized protein n=1 Tax=Dekkera bruxellensis TaxID=5007 RepID=A0A871R0V0_DEKBR|nr:uncharacterized protein BRETT_004746 [Brettanomyces bruxellensis]QOU20097.1 hypothetical protein BRETT_004746 [Brettanomyces bruxellensis]
MTGEKAVTKDLTSYLKAGLTPPAIRTPGVLTIAGSDCSGGAGLEADMKTITLCKCYAMTCITALTAQNSKGVHAVYPTSAETVEKVLTALKNDELNLKAVKVGLLPSTCIEPVSKFLKQCHQMDLDAVVLDPVFVANSGDSFGSSQAPQLISIFKYCRLITPNFAEAEIILSHLKGYSESKHVAVTGVESLCEAAATIGKQVQSSILIKGGHIPFNAQGSSIDKENPKIIYNVLYDDATGAITVFKSNYIDSENTHGTGCTMSSFIASSLASGYNLKESVQKSIEFLNEAIRRSIPQHNGSVNHLWRVEEDINLEKVAVNPKTFEKSSPFSPKLNLLNNLIMDKDVNPIWISFTQSDFFRSLNDGTMRESAIRHFLLQDYRYLKTFLACHWRLHELAPTPESREKMADAARSVEKELSGHIKFLKTKFGIDNPEEIGSSPALLSYVNYMEKYQKGDSFLDLETALIPCQFGFNPAVARYYKPTAAYDTATGGKVTTDLCDFVPCKSQYESWLQAAVSPSYHQVLFELQSTYNSIFSDTVAKGETSYNRLKKIFAEGCQQEYDFWNECYNS